MGADESLVQLKAAMVKKYGQGSLLVLGDTPPEPVEVIKTGSLALDYALGVGGMPRGRIVEIYGQESSGKTTIALHIIAEAQKAGGHAAYVDAEHALDPIYARNLGVLVDNLLVSQPDYGEQALNIVEDIVESGLVSVVVVDSVAALVPKAELDGEMEDQQVGLQARLMSKAMRKLTGVANTTNTLVIFINQLREKVGVMFGNPETTPGGRALKFYSSIRLEVKRSELLKKGETVVGHTVRCRVVKNKVAAPFRQADFDIIYGRGIDGASELCRLAELAGVVTKKGNWYRYQPLKGAEVAWQGVGGSRPFFEEHPEIFQEISSLTRQALMGGTVSL